LHADAQVEPGAQTAPLLQWLFELEGFKEAVAELTLCTVSVKYMLIMLPEKAALGESVPPISDIMSLGSWQSPIVVTVKTYVPKLANPLNALLDRSLNAVLGIFNEYCMPAVRVPPGA
jgi:hypothetical protein